ncbi:hypothetical protein BD408DRAFT_443709 [Parasitella parasitica]|nr:hypothetical protein BD408DRAFT_443709 [Parasitella parasitica]
MPSTIKRTNSARDSPEPESSRSNKRAKKTTSFQGEDSEEDSEMVDPDEADHDITTGADDQEDEVSDDDNDNEDEEEENGNQTAIIQSRPRRTLNFDKIDYNNMAINEAGTISRVEVVNFMCHKFLQIDLGPKINFVIGHNGSGKSAILTAITVALGANASATNRGKSMSSFIKEGTSAAIVTIHLTNNGPNAYRPDLYPERIVVERRINKEGGSPYKLKNKAGRIISQKKEDLLAILDHLNLLVNNPLTMLTQDMARKFLSDSTSEDKYKLFMHGTQLTQLQNDYEAIREGLESNKQNLDRKKEGLQILQSKAAEAQRKYEDMQAAKEVESKIDELSNELVWSQIIIKEKEVARNLAQTQALQKELDNIREAQDVWKSKVHEVDQQILSANEEWEAFRALPNPDQEEKAQLIQDRAEKTLQKSSYKGDLNEINRKIKLIKESRLEHTKQLKIETDKLEASSRLKRNEILQEIEKCKEKMAERITKAKNYAREESELQVEIGKCEESKRSFEFHIAELNRRKEQAQKNIRELENQRGDKMRAYGARMPQVLKAIREETRWEKRRPIGPFGSTLELLQPEFANVLESVLNKSMNGFVVETFKDRDLLVKILRHYQMHYISVFVSDFDIFDYSSGEPDPHYITALRALKFSDEWVKRQLITMNKVEKMLLMKNRERADEIMFRKPKNIDLCFTDQGYKVGGKSGMKTESVDKFRGIPRFQKDVEGAISYERNIINETNVQLGEKNDEWKIVCQKVRELENQRRECQRGEHAIKREIAVLESSIAQKKETLKEEDPVDLNIFHDDIAECDEKTKRYISQFNVINAQMIEVNKTLTEITRKIEALQSRETERLSMSDTYKFKIEKIEQTKTRYLEKLSNLNVQAQTMKVRHERSRGIYNESNNMLKSWLEQSAEDYPDRYETNRKPEVIERDIRHYEGVAQESANRAGMSLTEAQEQTYTALKEYEEAKKVISGLLKIQKSMGKMLTARIEKWEAFRAYISLAAKSYFGYYLHLRGDEGSLRFNHSAKKLEIRVSTGDQYSKGSRQKDSRSLSGGEKSFSQISLLLSLWQSISSPLICLDEFDVFMDAVNRKQTMGMIMNAASDNTSQYILITPQDASNMEPGPFITVHRMADPDRAQ